MLISGSIISYLLYRYPNLRNRLRHNRFTRTMARRQGFVTMLIILVASVLGISFIWQFRSQAHQDTRHASYRDLQDGQQFSSLDHAIDPSLLSAPAHAAKLENATLKAELGRSSWHLFHTMMAKFPDKPDPSDSEALKSYIYLFARLYPCGDCARHFQSILQKYPPQVSSRSAAATWGCHVHNEVNDSLGKKKFDCSKIGDFYDCGCAEDETEKILGAVGATASKGGRKVREEKGFQELELQREEGLTRGG